MLGSIMKRAALLALAIAPVCHAQQQLVGNWHGTLSAPGGTLHLAWHVQRAPDGSITAAFDNVDDQVLGIQVKSLHLDGSGLTFTIDTTVLQNGESTPVAGNFKGTLSADGNQVSGVWDQSAPQVETDQIQLQRDTANPPATPPRAAAPDSSAQRAIRIGAP